MYLKEDLAFAHATPVMFDENVTHEHHSNPKILPALRFWRVIDDIRTGDLAQLRRRLADQIGLKVGRIVGENEAFSALSPRERARAAGPLAANARELEIISQCLGLASKVPLSSNGIELFSPLSRPKAEALVEVHMSGLCWAETHGGLAAQFLKTAEIYSKAHDRDGLRDAMLHYHRER